MFAEEQPIRKVSNIGAGAAVQLLKKANQDASESAPKKVITLEKSQSA